MYAGINVKGDTVIKAPFGRISNNITYEHFKLLLIKDKSISIQQERWFTGEAGRSYYNYQTRPRPEGGGLMQFQLNNSHRIPLYDNNNVCPTGDTIPYTPRPEGGGDENRNIIDKLKGYIVPPNGTIYEKRPSFRTAVLQTTGGLKN